MTTIRSLHAVHGKTTDRIDRPLVNGRSRGGFNGGRFRHKQCTEESNYGEDDETCNGGDENAST